MSLSFSLFYHWRPRMRSPSRPVTQHTKQKSIRVRRGWPSISPSVLQRVSPPNGSFSSAPGSAPPHPTLSHPIPSYPFLSYPIRRAARPRERALSWLTAPETVARIPDVGARRVVFTVCLTTRCESYPILSPSPWLTAAETVARISDVGARRGWRSISPSVLQRGVSPVLSYPSRLG